MNKASPASKTVARNALANLPPGSFLQIQEYIFVTPDFLGLPLSILVLDQRVVLR
jgi:hypothetical protein